MNPFPYALKEFKRRKYRTITNIFGIIIAVSTLITLVMASRGWETCTTVPLNSIGTDIIFIYTAPIEPKGSGCYVVNHLFSYPFNQTLLNEIEKIPNVINAVPILMHRLRAMVFTGIDPSETETNAVLEKSIIEGRYLKADDGLVAIIDKEYANYNNLTLGSIVNYVSDFEVVGIVEVSATNIMKSHIYVNLDTAQKILPEKPIGLVNLALIKTSPDKVDITSKLIEEKWPNSSTLTSLDLAQTASSVIQISEDTAWIISIVVTIITILFVIKSQLDSIIERTKEIGILKAIGWSNKDVTNQIVLESLIQGISGGIIGCILGYILATSILATISGEVGSAQNFVSIDLILLVIGFGIAMISTIGTGFLSSLRASKLVPAEALRTI